MAVVFDTASSNGNSATAASGSHNHAVTAGGTGRILVVGVIYWRGSAQNITLDSLTYGGQALTRLSQLNVGTGRAYVELWRLVNPPTGTNSLAYTFSAATLWSVGGVSYTGVNVNNPFGTEITQVTNSASAWSVAVVSNTDELAISVMGIDDTAGGTTLTEGASQTRRVTEASGTGSTFQDLGMDEEAGAASVTMSWTSSGTANGGLIGVSLKPAVSSVGRSVAYFHNTLDGERIYDHFGRLIPRDQIMADRWMRSTGAFLPSSRWYSSLVEDPSAVYIEAVRYNGRDDSISIETQTEAAVESLLRRLGRSV